MDKGQHLRLFIMHEGKSLVVAMSTELTLHGSAQVENSTTKDTTDSSGAVWDENDVVGRSYNIDFTALVAVGSDDDALTFSTMMTNVDDSLIDWEIAYASGENNRTKGMRICNGKGKLSNIQASAQVSQQVTYSGTINGYGPLVPGTLLSD